MISFPSLTSLTGCSNSAAGGMSARAATATIGQGTPRPNPGQDYCIRRLNRQMVREEFPPNSARTRHRPASIPRREWGGSLPARGEGWGGGHPLGLVQELLIDRVQGRLPSNQPQRLLGGLGSHLVGRFDRVKRTVRSEQQFGVLPQPLVVRRFSLGDIHSRPFKLTAG